MFDLFLCLLFVSSVFRFLLVRIFFFGLLRLKLLCNTADGELMLYPYWLPMPDIHMKIEEKNITLED